MNCRAARQLISPYLDGQLTGREMLALGDHLENCESCQQEIESLRQVKALLRGLAVPRPPLEFSRQLTSQEIYAQNLSWRVISLPPRPQRGRRLMAALALSCLTLFVLVPASRDGQVVSSSAPLSAFPEPAGRGAAGMLGTFTPPDAQIGPPAYALTGTPSQNYITFAGTFDRSFSYPPSYEPPAAPFSASHSSDQTILTGYRRR